MPTALLEPNTESPPEALIEEARGRQRQRRALFAFLVLLVSAVTVMPFLAGDGPGSPQTGDELLGGLTTSPRERVHTATAVLYVAPMDFDTDPRSGSIRLEEASGMERLKTTFRAMIESRHIVGQAIRRVDTRRSVGDVVRATAAQQSPMTNLIEVSVTDRNARTARRLANAITDVFVEQINDVQPGAKDDNLVAIYERARESS